MTDSNPYAPPEPMFDGVAACSASGSAPDSVTLTYRKAKRFVGLFAAGLVGVLALGCFFERDIVEFVPVLGLVGPAGTLLILEFWLVHITADADGIRTQSPWRSPRTIPWDDVSRVEYSKVNRWYRIHTRSHGVVRCHVWLDGLVTLLAILETRGFAVPPITDFR